MRSGSKRIAGLMLAGALVLAGCSGEETAPDDTAEPSLSVPPIETEEVSNGDGDALELEAMSDDELLAEAERAYQGYLDEVEELRATGSHDYEELEEWVTNHFRDTVSELMDDLLPDGFEVQNAPALMWIQLSNDHSSTESEVFANVCLDNTPIRVFNADGADVTNPDTNQVVGATVRFLLNEERLHLQVDWERSLEESEERECSLEP